jgi:hypothetical protein
MRKNREVLRTRKKQRSLMLIDIGRYFYTVGKTKKAMRFLAAAIKDHPPHLELIGTSLLGKLFRRLRPHAAS